MSINLRTKANAADVDAIVELLPKAVARRVIISAVSEAAKFGETKENRLIRETVALSRKAVDNAIVRRTTRDDAGGFGQSVIVSRAKQDLKDLKPRQTKAGLTVRMLVGQKSVRMRSAFLVATRGGQAFRRYGTKRAITSGTNKGKVRQPIRKLLGPTAIGGLTRRKDQLPAIQEATAERLSQRLLSKLDYEFEKIAARAAGKKRSK